MKKITSVEFKTKKGREAKLTVKEGAVIAVNHKRKEYEVVAVDVNKTSIQLPDGELVLDREQPIRLMKAFFNTYEKEGRALYQFDDMSDYLKNRDDSFGTSFEINDYSASYDVAYKYK